MPSQSDSPLMARFLLVAVLLALGFLATISVSDRHVSRPLRRHNVPPKDEPMMASHEKRLLGMGGIVGVVPSLLGNLVPSGVAGSLVAQVTANLNSLLPILDGSSTQGQDGVHLVTGEQAAPPLTVESLPTGAQLGSLADRLGDLLNGVAPAAAPSIIAAITKQALGVISSVEAIATDVASLDNQITSHHIQAPDALSQIGGLLGSLDSKVGGIVNNVTSDLYSDLPLPVLQDLSQAISSGLGNIVGASNGPLSLIGDLIEQNICGIVTPVDGLLATIAGVCGDIPAAIAQVSSEIATAPLTNPDVTLTGDISTTTMLPNSPTPTGNPATIAASTSPNPQDQGTSIETLTTNTHESGSNPAGNSTTSSPPSQQSPFHADSLTSPTLGTTVGASPTTVTPSPLSVTSAPLAEAGTSQTTATASSSGIITVTEYRTTIQPCASAIAGPMTAQTVTLTVYPTCPVSPCVPPPQATCNCPNANPIPAAGNGPCPGTGYTCDDCLDGWFCPPSQTPAQPAPCGFGWPCAHCEGGWFCAPIQTPGPCIASSVSGASSSGTTTPASTSFSSPTLGGSVPSRPSPPPPDKVTSWGYCGCWADDQNRKALAMETFNSELLTNEACVQHCIIRGYIMAGTEKGNLCFCGNFLNSTQKVDERECSMPCSGDATQFCGSLNALSCYSPDGQPYGWADAGPQPRAPTILPPEVRVLDIGGVAQTQITTPSVIFPPENANPDDIIRMYGENTSQPFGELPRYFTILPSLSSPSTPPFGGGGVAPGRGTLTPTYSPTASISDIPDGSTNPSITPSSVTSTPNVPNGPSMPSIPGNPNHQSISSDSNTLGTLMTNTPGTPGVPNTLGTSSTPSIPSTPGTSGTSTSPSGNGSVAPGQGTASIPPSNGASSPSHPTEITPTGPETDTVSISPSDSVITTPPNNPSGSTPGIPESSNSTPNGGSGVAPGHGQVSSTALEGEGPGSVPSRGSTVLTGVTPPETISGAITPTRPSNSGQATTITSTNIPGGSESCVPGIDMNCSPSISNSGTPTSSGESQESIATPSRPQDGNGNPSTTTPGQTERPMSSGGGNTSDSTSLLGSRDPENPPSPPFGGGGVAPGHGQPSTSPLPSGNSIICTSGSTNSACISYNPNGSTFPGQSQRSSWTSNSDTTTCSQGSDDPACTSPVGGAGVAPGHGQPTPSMPGNIPSTCTAGSTDLECTSPISGGGVPPSHNQPTSPTSYTNSYSPTISMSQTSPPGAPPNGDICPPGLADPDCSSPGNGSDSVSTKTPNQTTMPISSLMTSTTTVVSTTPGDGGSEPNGQGLVTLSTAHESSSPTNIGHDTSAPPKPTEGTPPSSPILSPGRTSPSTLDGAGGVAPGQQSPSTHHTPPNPSEGSDGSITPSTANAGSSSPLVASSVPEQPTALNPNQGSSTGPNPVSGSPQTSYTYPPGIVPYGAPSPSMTTLASMLAWREPNGEIGGPTMVHPAILHDSSSLPQRVPELELEEPPGAVTTVLKSADPRWQRIRPVYVW